MQYLVLKYLPSIFELQTQENALKAGHSQQNWESNLSASVLMIVELPSSNKLNMACFLVMWGGFGMFAVSSNKMEFLKTFFALVKSFFIEKN